MLINARTDINAITRGDLVAEAKRWGAPEANAAATVTNLLEAMSEAVPEAGFEARLEATIVDRIKRLVSSD